MASVAADADATDRPTFFTIVTPGEAGPRRLFFGNCSIRPFIGWIPFLSLNQQNQSIEGL